MQGFVETVHVMKETHGTYGKTKIGSREIEAKKLKRGEFKEREREALKW